MFCEKCGNQLPDEAKFCDKCGARVGEPAAENDTLNGGLNMSSQPDKAKETVNTQSNEGVNDSGDRITKKYIISVCIVTILIVAGIMIFRSALSKRASENELNNRKEDIDSEISDTEETNIDDENDNSTANEHDLKEVDLFEGVEVTFSGTAPYGEAQVTLHNDDLNQYEIIYTLDKETDLTNGDVVTVQITDHAGGDPTKYLKDTCHVKALSLEKTFTVENLPKYVERLDEIPESLMARMKKQAEETYLQHFEEGYYVCREDWDGDGDPSQYRRSKLESFSYVGDILLTAKYEEDVPRNILVLLYKPVVSFDWKYYDGAYEGWQEFQYRTEHYWALTFSDIMFDQEGTVVADLENYEKTEHEFKIITNCSGRPDVRLFGYEELEDLRRDYISKNLEKYNHEDNLSDVPVEETSQNIVENDNSSEDSDYILPSSSVEYISKKDLDGLTDDELKIARNEIYARHGRKFQDEELQQYFDKKSWYTGSIEPEEFDDTKMLNDYEIKNLDLIVQTEKNR